GSLAILLRHWGHDVAVVLDGQLALKIAIEFRPHVALMDLALPGMDGYDVAGRLRDAPGLGGARLIAVSGYSKEEGERRHPGGRAGSDVLRPRPGAPARLRTILGALAGEGAARPVTR